jgi:hypothetical protein
MSGTSLQEQLEAAREAPNPFEALYGIAESLRNSGVSQVGLYHVFTEFLEKHRNDNDETFFDNIADVLDCIWSGGWGKKGDLFDGSPNDVIR